MKKKKSLVGSLVTAAAAVVFAGSAGYLVYTKVISGSSGLAGDEKKNSWRSSSSDKNKKGSRPKGAISRRKDLPAPNVEDREISNEGQSQPKVEWIPNLRVREKKILDIMPSGKEVCMTDVQKHFPDVTARTLRRDMERLVQKGRVLKSGTTRATTYRKV